MAVIQIASAAGCPEEEMITKFSIDEYLAQSNVQRELSDRVIMQQQRRMTLISSATVPVTARNLKRRNL